MLKVFFYISFDKFSESRVKTSEQSEKDNDQKKGKYQLSCVSGCFPFIPNLEQLLPHVSLSSHCTARYWH